MAYNAQQIMSDIQGQNLNSMRNLIIKANNDPRSLTEEQLQLAMQYGQQLGIDMSPSMKRNTGTALENVGAFTGGILDSLAFGFIPDNLYSSYRTKRARNAGELLGTGLSFAIPALGVGAGAKALLRGAKGLKGLKTVKSVKGLSSVTGDAIKITDIARDAMYVAKGDYMGAKALAESSEQMASKLLKQQNMFVNKMTKQGLKGKAKKEALKKSNELIEQATQANNKAKELMAIAKDKQKVLHSSAKEYGKLFKETTDITAKHLNDIVTAPGSKSFMETPLKDLMPKLSEGSSTIMDKMKQVGNISMDKAQNLTPAEILNMAKAIIQMGRTPGNVFGTISPDSDTSQLNPYTQSMGIGGMPQMP